MPSSTALRRKVRPWFTASRFRLPLVHHLVEHGVLHFGPGMAQHVAPADRDLARPAAPDIHHDLTEAGAHPAGQSDRDHPQGSSEMVGIESLVQGSETLQQCQVSRTGAIAALGPRRRRGVLLDREGQKLAFGPATGCPGHPWVEEPDDGAEHPVRGAGVAAVQPEHAARREADHTVRLVWVWRE
jgi:hypothetical protein